MSYKRSTLMQQRMQQNRQTMLQSARQLIAEGGIKDAQIQAIAERSGVSSGLVYRYFENKSQVIIEVLSAAIAHEIEILNHIANGELTATQKLHKAVKTFVKRAMNSPQLAYSLMFEPVDPQVEHERFHVKQLIKESIKEILKQGHATGEFYIEDLNTVALSVVGAMTYVVIEPLNPAAQSASDQDQVKTQLQTAASSLDQSNKEQFARQIADFCCNAVTKPMAQPMS